MAAKPSGNKSVLVIGLGRFGGSVAATLDQMGQDVLAVDKNPELVARWSAHLPTIQADMTDVLAIEQIDASQFDTAVVAIGDSIEASVIITGNLLDAGVSDLWAKSVSQEHARILQRASAPATSSTRRPMPASAWAIWWPAIIWITSKSTGRTPSSRSTRPCTR